MSSLVPIDEVVTPQKKEHDSILLLYMYNFFLPGLFSHMVFSRMVSFLDVGEGLTSCSRRQRVFSDQKGSSPLALVLESSGPAHWRQVISISRAALCTPKQRLSELGCSCHDDTTVVDPVLACGERVCTYTLSCGGIAQSLSLGRLADQCCTLGRLGPRSSSASMRAVPLECVWVLRGVQGVLE